ncbi:MAG: DinB family protein [Caldilineaceae bacterium]|nr:DinB family protein [Caldilineaceae bacterium]
MESPVLDVLRPRIQLTHGWVLNAVVGLTTQQLDHRFGPTSPPLGWHLWHVARWADRLQASFTPRGDGNSAEPSDPNRDIWHIEGLAAQWKLDPAKLGVLETGPAMTHDDATALAVQINKIALLDYVRRSFSAVEQALATLSDADLQGARTSIKEYRIQDNTVFEAPGEATTHLADILFHFSHTTRHLGMMEGLRGLLDMEGTITV